MDLIIGGAYQGKLEYARKKYSLSVDDIFTCSENKKVDFGKRCIYNIENYTLWCVTNNIDAIAFFKEHKDEWQSSILICEDIFCGVVPIEKEMRAWREMTGKLCAYLSCEAEHVVRMFCGLEQKLK